MYLILLIIILLVIFGGGIGFYGHRRGYAGPGLNLLWVLLLIIIIFAVLQYGGYHRFY